MGFLDTMPNVSGKQPAPVPADKPIGSFLSSMAKPAAPAPTTDKPLGGFLSRMNDATIQPKPVPAPAPTPAPTFGQNVGNFFKGIPDVFGNAVKGTEDVAKSAGGSVVHKVTDFISSARSLLSGQPTAQQKENFGAPAATGSVDTSDLKISQGPKPSVFDNINDKVLQPIRDNITDPILKIVGMDSKTGEAIGQLDTEAAALKKREATGYKLTDYDKSVIAAQKKSQDDRIMAMVVGSQMGMKVVSTSVPATEIIDSVVPQLEEAVKANPENLGAKTTLDYLKTAQKNGSIHPAVEQDILQRIEKVDPTTILSDTSLSPEAQLKEVKDSIAKDIVDEIISKPKPLISESAGPSAAAETTDIPAAESAAAKEGSAPVEAGPEQPTVAEQKTPITTSPDIHKLAKEAYADFNEKGIGPKEPPIDTEELKRRMQGGYINPGAMAEDAAQSVKDAQAFLEKSRKVTEFTGDVDKDLNILRTSTKADNIIAKEYLKNVKISPADAEAIYHYAEDKTAPISEEQKAVYEKYVKPLQDERDRLFSLVKNEGVPINREDYTPRFVAGKGGVFEKLKQGGKSVREGGLLRKTTGSFKKRVMRTLVDETGKRQVVAVKGGRVTGFNNKVTTDLGRLKLSKYQDLIDREIEPIQKRLHNLQKELTTLASVKMRSPISQARLAQLHEKIVEMHVEKALSALLDKEKMSFTPRERTSMRLTIKEISTLEKVKKAEGVVLTQKRIATLSKKIVEVVNHISNIESQYPDDTNAKMFIDKNGKAWKMVDATTKEIEQHTNLTYHKNILLNELISYTRLKQVARATEFLTKVKESPQFSEFAVKVGEGDVPKGWKPTTMPQFTGYNFEPKVADVLDNFNSAMKKGDVLRPLTALNGFLRTSIFFNPFIHIPNIVNHAVVARGTYRLALPSAYARLYKSTKMAFKDIATLSPRYQKMLESGVNLMYGDTTAQLTDLMVKKMGEEVKANPQIPEQLAKALGVPLKTVQFVFGRQGLSSKITWFTNDFFTLQAIYEKEMEGLTTEEAIHEVGKHIPNYQIPARILNQRVISQVMQNSNLTMFGAYHYGALKSYGEMVKSLVTGDGAERPMQYNAESGKRTYGEYYDKESFKKRAEALDVVVMAAIVGLLLYPLADKFLQTISGNKKMQVRRAGSTTILYNTWKLLRGKEDFSTFIQSLITPAIGTKAIAQLFTNTDFYTRQKLINPGSELQDLLKLGEESIAPVNQAQQLISGTKNPGDFMLGLVGISTPKTTPSEINIYDLIYNRRDKLIGEVKGLYAEGKTEEADKKMATFNQMLLKNAIDAFEENGFKIKDEKALKDYLVSVGLKGKFITPPTQKQIDDYNANQKKTNLQKIIK